MGIQGYGAYEDLHCQYCSCHAEDHWSRKSYGYRSEIAVVLEEASGKCCLMLKRFKNGYCIDSFIVEKVLVGWKWCRNQGADNTTLGQTNMDSRTCSSISRTMPAHYTYCFMIPASYFRCIQTHNNKPSSSICFLPSTLPSDCRFLKKIC